MGGQGSGRPPRRQIGANEHGLVERYSRGCRCKRCRAAWATYMRERRAKAGPRPVREPRRAPEPKRDFSYYHGKVTEPVSTTLTPLGREILDVAQVRTERSRGDIFEHLLRLYGGQLEFTEGAA